MPMDTKRGRIPGVVPLDIANRMAPPGRGDVGVGQGVPKVLQIFPWWLYKPPTGIDVNKLDANVFLAPGVFDFTTLGLTLSQSQIGIIRGIDLYVNDMTETTDVTFTLAINGAAIPGYGQLTPFPRTAASVSQSFDTFIFLPSGSIVTVQAENFDGGAYAVGFGYQGWIVPSNIDSILGVAGGAYTGAS